MGSAFVTLWKCTGKRCSSLGGTGGGGGGGGGVGVGGLRVIGGGDRRHVIDANRLSHSVGPGALLPICEPVLVCQYAD